MLHRIGRPPVRGSRRGLSLTASALDSFLEQADRSGLQDAELSTFSQTESGLALTFDDGFEGLVEQALPVLQRRKRTATTYLLSGLLGQWNVWDFAVGAGRFRLMDVVQVKEWLASGQRIGSHGISHRSLLTLSAKEARQEIFESRQRLSDLFGLPIDDFCYPFGEFSAEHEEMVREAGYLRAVSIAPGVNGPAVNALALHRIGVTHRRPWLAALLPGPLSAYA